MAIWSDKLICERSASAEQARGPILPYIRDCLAMTMPWRLNGPQGGAAFDRLFDSTAMVGLQRGGARLQRDLTPPFQRWFELEAGPLVDPRQTEAVNRALETPTQICHSVLDASAFHTASAEAYSDLLVGTGAILGVEGSDDAPINWRSAPAWQLAIEEGPTGRVDNVFWKKAYPAWSLPRHWPNAGWGEKVRKLIADQSADKVVVRQATYYDADLRGWRLAILENEAERCVYDSARDRTNPWIIFRYWTTPGDPWGRGPVMLALPDIRTANKTVEMILRAAAFALAPPLMVLHDGVVNPDTLRLAPNALIRVARTGGNMGRSIEPLQLGSNVNMAQIVLEDLRQNISKNLLSTQLPPDSGAVRSASEVIERAKQLQYDAGAAFGRLNHEYVPQVVARVLDILDRKKVTTILWDQLKIDQLVMRVKVTSPLARSQNLEDVQTIVQFWEMAKALGGEEAFLQIANTEDGLPKLAKLMGVPLWAVNDADRRAALAQAAGKMAAQVMAANGNGPQAGPAQPGPYTPAPATALPNLGVAA